MNPVARSIYITVMLLIGSSIARAHVEGAELAVDVVWEKASVRLDLRIAVRELINAEQPIDSVVLPDYTQDPKVVTERHVEEILQGFQIKYDGKPLTPRLIESSVQQLVIGVNEEDIVPRTCAVYSLEFTGVPSDAPPSRIDLIMEMFKLPLEAGFQPTVLCLVSHRLADSQTTRTGVIGLEDVLTLKPQWTETKAAAPGAVVTKAVAPDPEMQSTRGRGPLIMLGLAAAIGMLLVVVLAKRGTA